MVPMSTHTDEYDLYEEDNNKLVIAVQVRSVDPPQLVAEDLADLVDHTPFDSEQCDSCGCSGYTIRLLSGQPADRITSWYVVCTGTDFADGFVEGCGTEYHLTWRKGAEVTW
jgi:hypothetical protein